MLRDYSIENLPNGRYFGKRYLQVGDFIRLCDFVGLRSCSEYELESYEEKRIMFPAARTVMPEEYARAFWQQSAEFDEKYMPFHRLDSTIRYPTSIQNEQETDWRHPIDKSWGSVDGLKKPSTEDFTPWDKYIVDIPTGNFHVRQPSAMHFYHYWQIYELYDVRRSKMEMYKDNIVYPHLGSPSHNTPGELSYLFEASSYFHVLFSSCHSRLIQSSQTNNDGLPVFSQAQDNDLRQTVHNYAIETRRLFDLNEDALYKGLRQMMNLHFSYEEADRFKLSSALSMDIGWLVELISHSFNMPTEEISRKAGSVGGYTGNYLELLFPNRKKEVREKSICVLWRWSQEHNRRAPNNSLSDIELTNLLNYTEKTDIAWFEYVIADLNKSFFAIHSLRSTVTFLNLKALAFFPEALMRILIVNNGDTQTQNHLGAEKNPGMFTLVKLIFCNAAPDVFAVYQKTLHWQAKDLAQFSTNLAYLSTAITNASLEDEFVGINLALATLIRNFSSHLVLDDPVLLQGEYVLCVRSIISSTISIWKVAQAKNWVK